MKYLIRLTLVVAALIPGLAMAAAPSLQVNPLKYQSTMLNSDVEEGYVDVSNPSDTTLNIDADVQGFRQDDLAGDLTFFNNLPIQQAITLGLTQFQLAPQEAIRDTFTVDPTKLPQGGTYAAIFFRTIPPQQSSSASFVTESANVGTLLLLQNGPADAQIGQVHKFDLPFFQFGKGISGTAQYQNTNHSTAPVAFSPKLVTKVFPWGHGTKLTGPYVLPGSIRQFPVVLPGSFVGLLPVSIVDQVSGIATTRWVFALTGLYAFLFLFLVILLLVVIGLRVFRNQPVVAHISWPALNRKRPAKAEPVISPDPVVEVQEAPAKPVRKRPFGIESESEEPTPEQEAEPNALAEPQATAAEKKTTKEVPPDTEHEPPASTSKELSDN